MTSSGEVREYDAEYDQWGTLDQPLARYDKTADGEFYYSGNGSNPSGNYIQIDGVTFNKDMLISGTSILAYNADPDKVSFSYPATSMINTYDKRKNPITKEMYIVGNIRVAEVGRVTDYTAKSKYTRYKTTLCFNATGFGGKHTVKVRKLYGGKDIISGLSVPSVINSKADADGYSPEVKKHMDIALSAIKANGGSKGYDADMQAISDYIHANYTYSEMSCGAASILMDYSASIGVYGFLSTGRKAYDSGHVAFHLDSDPNKYYEAQGHD